MRSWSAPSPVSMSGTEAPAASTLGKSFTWSSVSGSSLTCPRQRLTFCSRPPASPGSGVTVISAVLSPSFALKTAARAMP